MKWGRRQFTAGIEHEQNNFASWQRVSTYSRDNKGCHLILQLESSPPPRLFAWLHLIVIRLGRYIILQYQIFKNALTNSFIPRHRVFMRTIINNYDEYCLIIEFH